MQSLCPEQKRRLSSSRRPAGAAAAPGAVAVAAGDKWHRCQRFWDRGLQCPYGSPGQHSDIIIPEFGIVPPPDMPSGPPPPQYVGPGDGKGKEPDPPEITRIEDPWLGDIIEDIPFYLEDNPPPGYPGFSLIDDSRAIMSQEPIADRQPFEDDPGGGMRPPRDQEPNPLVPKGRRFYDGGNYPIWPPPGRTQENISPHGLRIARELNTARAAAFETPFSRQPVLTSGEITDRLAAAESSFAERLAQETERADSAFRASGEGHMAPPGRLNRSSATTSASVHHERNTSEAAKLAVAAGTLVGAGLVGHAVHRRSRSRGRGGSGGRSSPAGGGFNMPADTFRGRAWSAPKLDSPRSSFRRNRMDEGNFWK